MFETIAQIEAAVGRAFAARPQREFLPVVSTPRSENARMLAIAAARRIRGVRRFNEQRAEDARYWKAIAPSAIAKAREWRLQPGFICLPA
ncbi:MAG: hypothetical protein Q7T61_19690 [Caulobacter sp.]|nr:hypothetical protein [Caulobacter sp.]